MTACDNADGPVNVFHESPEVSDLQITPSSLNFTGQDGVKDTLITFHVSARSNLPEDYSLIALFASASSREELAADTLSATNDDSGLFSGNFDLEMATSRFENTVVYVYPVGPQSGIDNRAEATVLVQWTDTGSPEILEIRHPDEITIPAAGEPEEQFFVAADVSHTVSLELIEQVNLDLYDDDENLIRSFVMADEHDEYETISGDGTYVQGFSVNSGNSPGNYTVAIHAVDIAGTPSDTLQSTFVFSQ